MKSCGINNLEELELLDLSKTETVNDIVTGMSKCSFSARCAGEVTDTLTHIIDGDYERVIVYDGLKTSNLGKKIQKFAKDFGFELVTGTDYANSRKTPANLLVIGRFSEKNERKIFEGARRNTIFINNQELSTPGKIKDGYFPGVLFTDPTYALTMLDAALGERIKNKKVKINEFIDSLSQSQGIALDVANGAKNLSRMANDRKYTVFMTMSGAMTIAQMSYVLCDMIDTRIVQSLTTTGAAMAHGLVESMGFKHYKHNPDVSDSVLTRKKLNRVTDTLEPEENFDHIEEIISSVLKGFSGKKMIAPSEFHATIGKYLHDHHPNERGILKSAYENGIPVFVAAFYDSEIGNDITTYNTMQAKNHKRKLNFNLELDNHNLIQLVQNAKRTGLFTVGGGVPRNWTQNVAPLIEIINGRTNAGYKERTFSTGIRIDPASMIHGHLSGCTYDEGKTWRKMDPNGAFVEIKTDATITWPFIAKYAIENQKIFKDKPVF